MSWLASATGDSLLATYAAKIVGQVNKGTRSAALKIIRIYGALIIDYVRHGRSHDLLNIFVMAANVVTIYVLRRTMLDN